VQESTGCPPLFSGSAVAVSSPPRRWDPSRLPVPFDGGFQFDQGLRLLLWLSPRPPGRYPGHPVRTHSRAQHPDAPCQLHGEPHGGIGHEDQGEEPQSVRLVQGAQHSGGGLQTAGVRPRQEHDRLGFAARDIRPTRSYIDTSEDCGQCGRTGPAVGGDEADVPGHLTSARDGLSGGSVRCSLQAVRADGPSRPGVGGGSCGGFDGARLLTLLIARASPDVGRRTWWVRPHPHPGNTSRA
jgi:hypothetical protein